MTYSLERNPELEKIYQHVYEEVTSHKGYIQKDIAIDALQVYAPNNLLTLCLWWCAANDSSDEINILSTVPNRINAFILALENSVRGNNRNKLKEKKDQSEEDITDPLDIDDGKPNSPTCHWGLENQLALCMQAAYDAAHPDNVYIPDVADTIKMWLPNYAKSYYANSPEQSQIKASADALADADAEHPAAPKQIRFFENFSRRISGEGLKTFYTKYGHPTSQDDKDLVNKTFRAVIDNLHFVTFPEPILSVDVLNRIKETLEALQGYTLTESTLKAFAIAYESEVNTFGEMQQHTLLYLITGKNPIRSRHVRPDLEPQQCLTPEAALLEMRGLCFSNLSLLTSLFKFGLRGAMLRTFVDPEVFWFAHQNALHYFMLRQNAPLSAQEAIQRIDGLTESQVTSMHFIEAVKDNNHEEVDVFLRLEHLKKILDDGDREFGRTALHWAAAFGYCHFINILVTAGANINQQTKNRETPIHIAAENGHAQAIRTLMRNGADVNTPNVLGVAPVYIAAQHGHTEAIAALHAAGANMNAPLSTGATPVYIAAKNGHAEAITALKNAGANMDVSMPDGRTPVYISAERGHVAALIALREAGANMNTRSVTGKTPRQIAIQNGHLSIVYAFPEPILSVDVVKRIKETLEALHGYSLTESALKAFAIAYESEGNTFGEMQQHTLLYLITGRYPIRMQPQYARPDLEPQQCLTPEAALLEMRGLHFSNLSIFTRLFKFGLRGAMLRTFGDPEVFWLAHQNALHYFIRKQHAPLSAQEAIQRIHGLTEAQVTSMHLIEVVKDNNYDKEGVEILRIARFKKILDDGDREFERTALHWAAAFGYCHFINILVIAGANINQQTKNRETPIHIAAENGHAQAIRTLMRNGADVNTPNALGVAPVYIAAQHGHTEAIAALHAAGAKMNAPLSTGATPVYIAAKNGHAEAITALKNAGANMDVSMPDGRTPVYTAAYYGNAAAITALKNAGANMNAPLPDGATPVYIAAERGHVAAITALREAGANINTPLGTGKTPMQIAIQNGHSDVVYALLNCGVLDTFHETVPSDVDNRSITFRRFLLSVDSVRSRSQMSYASGSLAGDADTEMKEAFENIIFPITTLPTRTDHFHQEIATEATNVIATVLQENSIRQAVEILQPYGFSETQLRLCILAQPRGDSFGPYERAILIYLVTGIHPLNVDTPPLRPEQCLSPIQALAEIHSLNFDQLMALEALFVSELTGDLLRTFNVTEIFGSAHRLLLIYLMEDHRPTLPPVDSMQCIQGLSTNAANTILTSFYQDESIQRFNSDQMYTERKMMEDLTLPIMTLPACNLNFANPYASTTLQLPRLQEVGRQISENSVRDLETKEAAEVPVRFFLPSTSNVLSTEFIRSIIGPLSPYGFTETFLLNSSLEGCNFGRLHIDTLIYLVSGIHPQSRNVGVYNFPPLTPRQCLSPEQAIEETRGLNLSQLSAIDELFALGLTGDLLRTFLGPQEFGLDHKWTLAHLMRDRNPRLSAIEAIERIQGLNYEEVRELRFSARTNNVSERTRN